MIDEVMEVEVEEAIADAATATSIVPTGSNGFMGLGLSLPKLAGLSVVSYVMAMGMDLAVKGAVIGGKKLVEHHKNKKARKAVKAQIDKQILEAKEIEEAVEASEE